MENTTLKADVSDIRLDKYLSDRLPEVSRSLIQKYIKEGFVLVNGKKAKSNQLIQMGDAVSFPEMKVKTIVKKEAANLDIIAETPDYVVVNKPAGMLVHVAATQSSDSTLVDALLKKFPEIKNVGDNVARPGIVHRLDRAVSGVMVVAKTQAFYEHIKAQFIKHTIKKEYVALVNGVILTNEGTIDFPLAHIKGKIVAHTKEQGGKASQTDFVVLKRYAQKLTLLSVFPKTGRTNQIRVHFQALGFPLVGETKYIPRNFRKKNLLDRIFLHAKCLTFQDLQGKEQTYCAPLPSELQSYLNELT